VKVGRQRLRARIQPYVRRRQVIVTGLDRVYCLLLNQEAVGSPWHDEKGHSPPHTRAPLAGPAALVSASSWRHVRLVKLAGTRGVHVVEPFYRQMARPCAPPGLVLAGPGSLAPQPASGRMSTHGAGLVAMG
jgi:hypothetical protein